VTAIRQQRHIAQKAAENVVVDPLVDLGQERNLAE
jgi:hypothetical protein